MNSSKVFYKSILSLGLLFIAATYSCNFTRNVVIPNPELGEKFINQPIRIKNISSGNYITIANEKVILSEWDMNNIQNQTFIMHKVEGSNEPKLFVLQHPDGKVLRSGSSFSLEPWSIDFSKLIELGKMTIEKEEFTLINTPVRKQDQGDKEKLKVQWREDNGNLTLDYQYDDLNPSFSRRTQFWKIESAPVKLDKYFTISKALSMSGFLREDTKEPMLTMTKKDGHPRAKWRFTTVNGEWGLLTIDETNGALAVTAICCERDNINPLELTPCISSDEQLWRKEKIGTSQAFRFENKAYPGRYIEHDPNKVKECQSSKLYLGNKETKEAQNWIVNEGYIVLNQEESSPSYYNLCQPKINVGSFSLLTYNTHLFKGSNAEIGGFFKGKKILAYDEERAIEIARKIKNLNPDIVCLQEVWALDMQKNIKTLLQDSYPYFYIIPDKINYESFYQEVIESNPIGKIAIGITDGIRGTSGLMLVSKYKIIEQGYKTFEYVTGDDLYAKKGVGVIVVEIPLSNNRKHEIRIGTTHCPTIKEGDKSEVLLATKTAAEETFGKANRTHDQILAGDFNLVRHPIEEYSPLNTIITKHNAIDIADYFYPAYECHQATHNSIDETYTVWSYGNKLTEELDGPPSDDNTYRKIIDYVFFSPGNKGKLRPDSVIVFHDWKLENGIDLSDHYPIYAKFKILE